jgi:hypothetical protein
MDHDGTAAKRHIPIIYIINKLTKNVSQTVTRIIIPCFYSISVVLSFVLVSPFLHFFHFLFLGRDPHVSNLDRTIGLAGREENVYLGPERPGWRVATMGPLVASGPNLEERVIVSAEIKITCNILY